MAADPSNPALQRVKLFFIFSLKLELAFAGPFLPCFWAGVHPMDTKHLKIELLTIFADGCKKHSPYRALRPLTGRCKTSGIM